MTARRRRRSEPQPVAHRGTRFTDSSDSHDGPFLTTGAPPDGASRSRPRGQDVRRLLGFESQAFDPFNDGVWGELAPWELPPYEAPKVRRNLPRGGFLPSPPKSSFSLRDLGRIRSSWKAFRALRVPFPQTDSLCTRRKARRSVLFFRRVAGTHLKRSPGRGGTYRRTNNSSWSCANG